MSKREVYMFWPPLPSKENLFPRLEELLWPEEGKRAFIGEGHVVEEFERECGRRFGLDYVLFTNSGTAGLDLALLGAGVGHGDEVVTTPLTCTATNTPIVMRQATPVFADVQYETGNIDPASVEGRITPNTKAIMCVHWGGYPCDMEELNEVARTRGLPLIVDGAHALGAEYHGTSIGNWADFTMFSLQAIKQMTTIDGGLLAVPFRNCSRERDLVERSQDPAIRKWFRKKFGEKVDRYFARNPDVIGLPEDLFAREIFQELGEAEERGEFKGSGGADYERGLKVFSDDYASFEKFWGDWQRAESILRRKWFGIGRDERGLSTDKGYNAYPTFESGGKFQGNNIGAAYGLAALENVDQWLARREEIALRYDEELAEVDGIVPFERKGDRKSGNWLYNAHVERRPDFVKTMYTRGIETSIVHERNDELPIFRRAARGPYPALDKLNGDRICLPLHQQLSDEDVDYVLRCIKQGW